MANKDYNQIANQIVEDKRIKNEKSLSSIEIESMGYSSRESENIIQLIISLGGIGNSKYSTTNIQYNTRTQESRIELIFK